ncbi:hypothetical protein SALWKB2_0910 [Snodgrassella alvi wkB2]|nr:hypothetical protein SALWKB2_0910 [Snodgrassella alvi wkB2]
MSEAYDRRDYFSAGLIKLCKGESILSDLVLNHKKQKMMNSVAQITEKLIYI